MNIFYDSLRNIYILVTTSKKLQKT